MSSHPTSPRPTGSSADRVLRRVLLVGGIFIVAVGVVGSLAGLMASGAPGVAGAVVGALLAFVMVALTAASILVANRFFGVPGFATIFFGIVLGTWLLKLVVFVVVLALLRGQDWYDPMVLFLTLVVAVVGSLVIDVVVVLRSRLPYVSDV